MICARCGADLPPGAMFCGECGSAVHPVVTGATARAAAPASAAGSTPTADERATAQPSAGDSVAIADRGDAHDPDRVGATDLPQPIAESTAADDEDRRSTRVVDLLEESGVADPSLVSGARAWPTVIAGNEAGSALHDFSGTAADPVPHSSDSTVDEATRMPDRAAPAAARFSLHFSTGESVTVDGTGLIGRRPTAQPGEYFDAYVTISDPGRSVSKTHLEYGQEGGVFWVSDRFSANGTVVREPDRSPRLCPAGMRSRVARGSRVDIGEQFFVVS